MENKENSVLEKLKKCNEVFWINSGCLKKRFDDESEIDADIDEAEKRLQRFAPVIADCFPETVATNGIIESPLMEIPNMKNQLENAFDVRMDGKLFLKQDSELPVSGSVKARGGIHEVLEHAEKLAIENHIIKDFRDDYRKLVTREAKSFFGQYKIQVGSTGNLGLSIGIMGAALGFETIVHMSADAKQWKKDLLRKKGATVIEYDGDYGEAVKSGREKSDANPKSYFVDDEKSKSLFCGYAVAARRLKKQLEQKSISVDESHPLFVYIPCGVGGAPGGIVYGLKKIFGESVKCFFVEPTHAPCMLLGLETKRYNEVCVQDFGIDGKTLADGLAVGRCSAFVGKIMEGMLDGEATVDDSKIFKYQKALWNSENIYIEPSSCAAFHGYAFVKEYIEKYNLVGAMKNATHIVWATGGAMVPQEIKEKEIGF